VTAFLLRPRILSWAVGVGALLGGARVSRALFGESPNRRRKTPLLWKGASFPPAVSGCSRRVAANGTRVACSTPKNRG